MAEKARPPITSSKPWTPEDRTSQRQRLVEVLRKPAPCYGRALDDALAFVADAFRYKTRKGTDTPYLTHLLAVMALVGEHGGGEEQMIAALLHDALEDLEGLTEEDLEARFGGPVADMVVALSDTTEHPKPDWRTRKVRYLERLAEEGPWVKLVSAADKLHNVQCLCRDLKRQGDKVWARFNAGKEDQLWYYRATVEALAKDWEDSLLDELRGSVANLEEISG
jgi:(p)ppGpp synthase/HD superfamily hydrolase